MFCPNCGFKNEEGARFCVRCGKSLTRIKEANKGPVNKRRISKKRSRIWLLLGVGLSVLLILLIFVVGAIFFRLKKLEENKENFVLYFGLLADSSKNLAGVLANDLEGADLQDIEEEISRWETGETKIKELELDKEGDEAREKFLLFSQSYFTYLAKLKEVLSEYPGNRETVLTDLEGLSAQAKENRDEFQQKASSFLEVSFSDDIFNLTDLIREGWEKEEQSKEAEKLKKEKKEVKKVLLSFLEIYCKSQDMANSALEKYITASFYNSSEIQGMLAGRGRTYTNYSIVHLAKINSERYNGRVYLSTPASEMGPAESTYVSFPLVKSEGKWLVDKP